MEKGARKNEDWKKKKKKGEDRRKNKIDLSRVLRKVMVINILI